MAKLNELYQIAKDNGFIDPKDNFTEQDFINRVEKDYNGSQKYCNKIFDVISSNTSVNLGSREFFLKNIADGLNILQEENKKRELLYNQMPQQANDSIHNNANDNTRVSEIPNKPSQLNSSISSILNPKKVGNIVKQAIANPNISDKALASFLWLPIAEYTRDEMYNVATDKGADIILKEQQNKLDYDNKDYHYAPTNIEQLQKQYQSEFESNDRTKKDIEEIDKKCQAEAGRLMVEYQNTDRYRSYALSLRNQIKNGSITADKANELLYNDFLKNNGSKLDKYREDAFANLNQRMNDYVNTKLKSDFDVENGFWTQDKQFIPAEQLIKELHDHQKYGGGIGQYSDNLLLWEQQRLQEKASKLDEEKLDVERKNRNGEDFTDPYTGKVYSGVSKEGQKKINEILKEKKNIEGQLESINKEYYKRWGKKENEEGAKRSSEKMHQIRVDKSDAKGANWCHYQMALGFERDAKQSYEADSKYNEMKGFRNFWKGVKNVGAGFADKITDDGVLGIYGMTEQIMLNNVIDKVNRGEQLHTGEKAMYDAYIDLCAAQMSRNDIPTTYRVGEASAVTIPFMVDMVLSGVAGEFALKCITKDIAKRSVKAAATFSRLTNAGYGKGVNIATKGSKPLVIGAQLKNTSKTKNFFKYAGKEVFYTPIQTMVMPTTYAHIFEDQANYKLRHNMETGWNGLLAWKSTADMLLETLTERSIGFGIEKGIGLASKGVNALSSRWFGKTLGDTKFAGYISKVVGKQKGGFLAEAGHNINGNLGEFGEEVASNLGNKFRAECCYWYTDEMRDDLRQQGEFSGEWVAETAGALLPMSFVFSGFRMAHAHKTGRQFVQQHDRMLNLLCAEGCASKEEAEKILGHIEQSVDLNELNRESYRLLNALILHLGEDEESKAELNEIASAFNDYLTSAINYSTDVADIATKYENMTPDERNKFEQGYKEFLELKVQQEVTSFINKNKEQFKGKTEQAKKDAIQAYVNQFVNKDDGAIERIIVRNADGTYSEAFITSGKIKIIETIGNGGEKKTTISADGKLTVSFADKNGNLSEKEIYANNIISCIAVDADGIASLKENIEKLSEILDKQNEELIKKHDEALEEKREDYNNQVSESIDNYDPIKELSDKLEKLHKDGNFNTAEGISVQEQLINLQEESNETDGNIYSCSIQGDTEHEYRIKKGDILVGKSKDGSLYVQKPKLQSKSSFAKGSNTVVVWYEEENGTKHFKQVNPSLIKLNAEPVSAQQAAEGVKQQAQAQAQQQEQQEPAPQEQPEPAPQEQPEQAPVQQEQEQPQPAQQTQQPQAHQTGDIVYAVKQNDPDTLALFVITDKGEYLPVDENGEPAKDANGNALSPISQDMFSKMGFQEVQAPTQQQDENAPTESSEESRSSVGAVSEQQQAQQSNVMYVDKDGNEVQVTDNGDGTYTLGDGSRVTGQVMNALGIIKTTRPNQQQTKQPIHQVGDIVYAVFKGDPNKTIRVFVITNEGKYQLIDENGNPAKNSDGRPVAPLTQEEFEKNGFVEVEKPQEQPNDSDNNGDGSKTGTQKNTISKKDDDDNPPIPPVPPQGQGGSSESTESTEHTEQQEPPAQEQEQPQQPTEQPVQEQPVMGQEVSREQPKNAEQPAQEQEPQESEQEQLQQQIPQAFLYKADSPIASNSLMLEVNPNLINPDVDGEYSEQAIELFLQGRPLTRDEIDSIKDLTEDQRRFAKLYADNPSENTLYRDIYIFAKSKFVSDLAQKIDSADSKKRAKEGDEGQKESEEYATEIINSFTDREDRDGIWFKHNYFSNEKGLNLLKSYLKKVSDTWLDDIINLIHDRGTRYSFLNPFAYIVVAVEWVKRHKEKKFPYEDDIKAFVDFKKLYGRNYEKIRQEASTKKESNAPEQKQENKNDALDAEIEAAKKGVQDVIDEIANARLANPNILNMGLGSLIMSPKTEGMLRLVPKIAKLTYLYIKKGIYKIEELFKKIEEAFGSQLKSISFTDDEIRKLFDDVTKFDYEDEESGETHTIAEWAQIKANEVENAENTPTSLQSQENDVSLQNQSEPLGTIEKRKDTRDNSDIWVVKLSKKYDDDAFGKLKDLAKSNNGYWSKFSKGFLFKTEQDANNFNNQNTKQNGVKGLETSTSNGGREGRYGEQNASLGSSQQQGNEHSDERSVDKHSGGNRSDDNSRSSGISGRTDSESVKISSSENQEQRTSKQRFSDNISAIQLMKELLENGQQVTAEQREILKRFSGWGGLGTFFNHNSNENGILRSVLSQEEYKAAELSINSAYYTPQNVVSAMWQIAEKLGFKGGNILEGSAGIGNILAQVPSSLNDRVNINAVEIDPITGNILKLLYPNANVQITGFQNTAIVPKSVDLAITNVPFVTGLRVYDPRFTNLSNKFANIHDFCIAKNILSLKEGGIGIFISSKNTLDKSNELLKWITSEGEADVIGAFRLNNTTFGRATSVTSDIIVVRKRVNNKPSVNAINVSTVAIEREAPIKDKDKSTYLKDVYQTVPLVYNKYFIDHPECMGGKMYFGEEKDETFRPNAIGLYEEDGIDQDRALQEWVLSFDKLISEGGESVQSEQNVFEQEVDKEKEGRIFIKNGQIFITQLGEAVPVKLPTRSNFNLKELTERYISLRDLTRKVYDSQTLSDEELGDLRNRLNSLYDSFVRAYGRITNNKRISFLRNDVEFGNVLSLERTVIDENTGTEKIIKADIFTKRLIDNTVHTAKNIHDAVILSVNKNNKIDTQYIANLLGKNVLDVEKELSSSHEAFKNPETGEFEISYLYLSGNVRSKLKAAESSNTNGELDENIKALKAVIPIDIPFNLLQFGCGTTWLPIQLYEDFANEKMGANVRIDCNNGVWSISLLGHTNKELFNSFTVRSVICNSAVDALNLLDATLNGKNLIVQSSKEDPRNSDRKITVRDANATELIANKIENIKSVFKTYAQEWFAKPEHIDICNKIVNDYNETYNNFVPIHIEESQMPIHFDNASESITLRQYQKQAVLRSLLGNVLFAHEAGSGKTFTLITSAMEMKRIGNAKKPMIVVQNSTIDQFTQSAKQLYPTAKILSISDINGLSQEALYSMIRYNDWDLIIFTKSKFNLIPDSDERKIAFKQECIDDKLSVIATSHDDKLNNKLKNEIKKLQNEISTIRKEAQRKKDSKQEAKAAANASAKAEKQLDRRTIAGTIQCFDDLGIDALLIDECHDYKKLGFATNKSRIKGIDTGVSKISASLNMKCRSVYDRCGYKNVIFASGTPINNTAAELWTFLRYLLPKSTLQRYHMMNFDEFVANFGRIETALEYSTSGAFKESTRFNGYMNVPELSRIFGEIADIVLIDDNEEVSKRIPKTDNEENTKLARFIYLEQNGQLALFMKSLRQLLKEYDDMSSEEKKANCAIPLVCFSLARKAAVDIRLVMKDAPDMVNSKTNVAVTECLKALDDYKEYNGTVAIFCDNYQRKRKIALTDENGNVVLNKAGLPKMIAAKGAPEFSVFEDIKNKLIAKGVPAEQIAIVTGSMSQEKRSEIFEKVNKGEIRVVMGGTSTLGIGVNMQERLCCSINMDIPYRPMDVEQRKKRMLRQGNIFAELGVPVRLLNLSVKDTLDISGYQLLEIKSKFTSLGNFVIPVGNAQFNAKRSLNADSIEYGSAVAELSGSQASIVLSQARRDLSVLREERNQWRIQQLHIANEIEHIEKRYDTTEGFTFNKYASSIQSVDYNIDMLNRQIALLEKIFPNGECKIDIIDDGVDANSGLSFSNLDEFSVYLKGNLQKRVTEIIKGIKSGEDYGQKYIDINVNINGRNARFLVQIAQSDSFLEGGTEKRIVSTSIYIQFQDLYGDDKNHKLDCNFVSGIQEQMSILKNGDGYIRHLYYWKEKKKELEDRLSYLKSSTQNEFPKEKELSELEDKVIELQEIANAEIEEIEKRYENIEGNIPDLRSLLYDEQDDLFENGDAENSGSDTRERLYEEDGSQTDSQEAITEAVQQEVERLGLGNEVVVVTDESELPPNWSSRKKANSMGALGFYDMNTKKVYVIVPNHGSVKDALSTVWHEVIAHKGLRSVLGEKSMGDLCDEVYRGMKSEQIGGILNNYFERIVDDLYKNHPEQYKSLFGDRKPSEVRNSIANQAKLLAIRSVRDYIADEYIASVAERGDFKHKIWNKVRYYFRQFLRKLGLKLDFSDAEINYILGISENNYKGPKNGENLKEYAKRIVSQNQNNPNKKKKRRAMMTSVALYRIGNKRKEDMRNGIRSKLTDISDDEIQRNLDEIEKLGEANKVSEKDEGNPLLEKMAYYWFVNGAIRLPEDNQKVLDAYSVVTNKKGINFEQYKSPMELLNANVDFVKSHTKTDPDTIKEFKDKKELPYGVVIYTVDDTEEGQQAVRQMINEHFGKDCNPWCLAQADEEGHLTESALYYWRHYNSYPKRIVFQNGKLIAFSANDTKIICYWDRNDKQHYRIPITQEIEIEGELRNAELEMDENGNCAKPFRSWIGDKKNGLYREWYYNDLVLQCNYKNGKLVGSYKEWDNKTPYIECYYNDNEQLEGDYKWYYSSGKLFEKCTYKNGKRNGRFLIFHEYGGVLEDANYKDNKLDGAYKKWDSNRKLLIECTYKDGRIDGLFTKLGRVKNGKRNYETFWFFEGSQVTEEEYKRLDAERTKKEVEKSTKSNDDSPIRYRQKENKKDVLPLDTWTLPERNEGESLRDWAARVNQAYLDERKAKQVASYNREMDKEKSKGNAFFRAMLDSAKPINDFVEDILERGGELNGENPYDDVSHAGARAQTQQKKYLKEYIQPLAKHIYGIMKSKKLDNLEITALQGGKLTKIKLRWNGLTQSDFLNDETEEAINQQNGRLLNSEEIIGVYALAKDAIERMELGKPDAGIEAFKEIFGCSAIDIVNAVEKALGTKTIGEFWHLMKSATDYILDYQVKMGYLHPDTRAEMERNYYVPQRGWQERDMEEEVVARDYVEVGRLYTSPYNAAMTKANGRKSLSSSPFKYIISIAYSTFTSVSNNVTKQKLADFCRTNEAIGAQTGAFTVKTYWSKQIKTGGANSFGVPFVYYETVDKSPTKEEFEHDDKIRAEIKKIQKKIGELNKENFFLEKMRKEEEGKEKIDKNRVKELQDKIISNVIAISMYNIEIQKQAAELYYVGFATVDDIVKNETSSERRQHLVQLMQDGRMVTLQFKNEVVSNSVNKAYKNNVQLRNFDKIAMGATRYISSSLTQYNPAFALGNFIRDYQTAMATIAVEQGARFAKDFHKNLFACMPALVTYIWGDKFMDKDLYLENSKYSNYIKEYFDSGAQTGFSFLPELNQIEKDFDKLIASNKMSKKIPQKAWQYLLGSLSYLTEFTEMSFRLSAYITARERGDSVDKASHIAKELTTNFDTHGEASNKWWMTLYSFFRAQLNGNYKFLKMLKKAPAGFFTVGGVYMLLGFITTLLMPNTPPDDDNDGVWASLYSRMTNATIGSVKIPIGHFMRMFWAMGVNVAQVIRNEQTWLEAGYNQLAFMADELLPSWMNFMNFIKYDESTGHLAFDYKQGIQGAMPTILQPVNDIALNRDFKGATLYGAEYPGSDQKKDILKTKYSTPEIYIKMANGIYEGLGGDLNVKNKMSDNTLQDWADISPTTYQHLVEGYAPIVGAAVASAGLIMEAVANERDLSPEDVNVIHRFYSPYHTESALVQTYWSLKPNIENYISMVKELEANNPEKFREEKQTERYKIIYSNGYVRSSVSDLIGKDYRNKGVLDKNPEKITDQDVKDLLDLKHRWIEAQ